jgi:hypothetical protein
LVLREALILFTIIYDHCLPEVSIAIARTDVIRNTLRVLQECNDIEVIKNALLLVSTILAASAVINEVVSDNSIKIAFDSLDGASVVNRYTLYQNEEIAKFAEQILIKFYADSQHNL